MTSYAPNAAIVTAPTPPDTGNTLTVGATGSGSPSRGMGDAFPDPPFDALVWPNQEFPVLGVNAEQVVVTGKDHDTFTFQRGTPGISITAGLRIAALATQRVYQPGDSVQLNDPSFSGTAPFTFRLQDPGGYEYTETRSGVDWGGTAGAGHLQKRGQYFYSFSEVGGRRSAEQDFFIAFTEVS